MRPVYSMIICCGLGLVVCGCTRHRVEVQPIKVEPIYLTIDVNVRVDRELDDFFDYKEPPAPITPGPGTVDPSQIPPPAPAEPVGQPAPVAEPIPASPSGVNQ